MEEKKLTYEQAIAQLEQLAQQMERGDVPIDEMAARLQQAQSLIKHCREQLGAADRAVQQILSPEDSK
jgi:exodeoxyribonuclease VII small subunit